MTGQDENKFEPNEQLLKVTTIILRRYLRPVTRGFAIALSANSYLQSSKQFGV